MRTIPLALTLLLACSPTPTAPTGANLARVHAQSGHGQVDSVAVTPDPITVAVGDTVVVTATYFDKQGRPFAANNQPITLWFPGSSPYVLVIPALGGATAKVVGLSVGTDQVRATNGVIFSVPVVVTVTP